MATKFVPNPLLAEEILLSPEVNAYITAKAQQVQQFAKSIVPVDTGVLQSSIMAEPSFSGHARVSTTVRYAGYVEFGTYKMAPEPYMRPALDMAARA